MIFFRRLDTICNKNGDLRCGTGAGTCGRLIQPGTMALTGVALGLVIACSAVVLIIFIFIISCCLRRDDADGTGDRGGDSLQTTEHLIPPVFYTADMKDPLLWPDLGDRIQ
jgi:hypothetical protein